MKKLLSALGMCLMTAPVLAYGSQGTDQPVQRGSFYFFGALEQTTCRVATESEVKIPEVGSNDLRHFGNATTPTPFYINLNNCPTSVRQDGQLLKRVSVKIAGSSGISSLGNLTNRSTAKNVEIRLLNGQDKQIINLNNPTNLPIVGLKNKSLGGVQLPLMAQLYATNTVVAGDVSASIDFEVVYK